MDEQTGEGWVYVGAVAQCRDSEKYKEQASCVLIIKAPPRSVRTGYLTYKNPSVEHRFAFLKDPVIVDGVYLKRSDRAYALGSVFLLALLVAAFLQWRIRHELAPTQDVLGH